MYSQQLHFKSVNPNRLTCRFGFPLRPCTCVANNLDRHFVKPPTSLFDHVLQLSLRNRFGALARSMMQLVVGVQVLDKLTLVAKTVAEAGDHCRPSAFAWLFAEAAQLSKPGVQFAKMPQFVRPRRATLLASMTNELGEQYGLSLSFEHTGQSAVRPGLDACSTMQYVVAKQEQRDGSLR